MSLCKEALTLIFVQYIVPDCSHVAKDDSYVYCLEWQLHWTVCVIIVYILTLKVLNFWKLTSYCSLKPLWLGMGGSSAGSYLADPTSPIPSHCASIAVTNTVRVN